MLVAPTTLRFRSAQEPAQEQELEFSVHRCPGYIFQDVQRVFSDPLDASALLLVPVFQKSVHDLVSVGPAVEQEKDRLLENFMEWGSAVCKLVQTAGYWADMTDPCSGYPVYGERSSSYYPDVIGAEILLKYSVLNTGCCKVLVHPRWTTKVYPATLFTTAPVEVVMDAIGGTGAKVAVGHQAGEANAAN